MITFTYDGISSSEFGIIVKNVRRQILPGNNHVLVNIPGRASSYVMPREPKDRSIDIECIITSNSFEGLRQKILNIADWLQQDEHKILDFSDQPGKYYRAILVDPIDEDQILTMSRFVISFVAEPYLYGGEERRDFVNDYVEFEKENGVPVLPRFEISFFADAAEWKITNANNNYIRIVNSFHEGDIMEINCKTGAIYINGIVAMDKLDWQYSRMDKFYLSIINRLQVTPADISNTSIFWVPEYK